MRESTRGSSQQSAVDSRRGAGPGLDSGASGYLKERDGLLV